MAYHDNDQRPFDLTILYMEDALEWCEYIFDLFTPFEVFQNSEDITNFPTQESTLEDIAASHVKIVIISPGFLEKCSVELEKLLGGAPKQVIGLLCGVAQGELTAVRPRLPSSKDWTLADAQEEMKVVTQAAMRILTEAYRRLDGTASDGEGGEEGELDPNYAVMDGGLSASSDQGNDLYAPMVGGELETEDLYVLETPQFDDTYDIRETCTYDPLTVVPSRIKCKSKKKFYIISSSSLFEDSRTYLVKMAGSTAEEHLEAVTVNPYVLTVSPPKVIPSGDVIMNITCEGSTIGQPSATVVSVMDELADNLRDCLEPLNFMCQSLGVSTTDVNKLDNLLYKHTQSIETTNTLKNALTTSQAGVNDSQKSDKRYPTALHFSANFGLKNITNYLLTLPGADNACKIRNRDNLTPASIAKKNGHSELSDIMQYLPELEHKTTGYVKMIQTKGTKPGYDKPKDVKELHKQIDDDPTEDPSQSIYDMIFQPSDNSFTRYDSDVEEDSNQNYDVVTAGTHKLPAGPHLPNRFVQKVQPPAVTEKPPTSSTEMSESQKQLWELDRLIEKKEITMEEAHKRFTQWTSLNMVPASIPAQKPTPKPIKQPWYKHRPTHVGSDPTPDATPFPKSPVKTGAPVIIPLPSPTTRPPSSALLPVNRLPSPTTRPPSSALPPANRHPSPTKRPPSSKVPPANRRSFIDKDYQPPTRDPPPIPPHSPPDDAPPSRPAPPPPGALAPVVAPRPKPKPSGPDAGKRPIPVPRH